MAKTNSKTFKDFIQEDLDVFINDEEFASNHLLNGENIDMVVVDNANKPLSGFGKNLIDTADGVYNNTITLYIKVNLHALPRKGERVEFDHNFYYVEHSSIEDNLIKIVLNANEY